MADQKNLILAIVISILILVGFQFFIEGPRQEAARQQAAQRAETQTEQPLGQPGTDIPAPEPGLAPTPGLPGVDSAGRPLGRDQALAQTQRIRIEAPRVHGSISLVGGRFDDLTLPDYRETVDRNSPEIELLSPLRAPSPYYADFGWTVADGADIAVPVSDTVWTADRAVLTPQQPVTLRWDNGAGLVFERTIAIDDNYMFTVTQRVNNNSGAPVALAPYGRILRFGTPETMGFFILHEGPYGVFDGTLNEYNYSNIEDDGTVTHSSVGGWLGFTDKYWLVALIPDQQAAFTGQFIHRDEAGQDRYFATFRGEAATIESGASLEATGHMFAGAKEVALIDQYENTLGIQQFDLAIDFGWFYFLTKPFFYILTWINGVVGNFGVAILIFTVLIKLLFFPLANKSYVAMSKMKALQPEMMKLRERFADDRARMNQELMALYKREKVNPAAGCLPILIQIPVFFALYKVLFVTIEMRHAPFFGWIQDLSAPDPTTIFNLFGLIPWDPPGFLMIGIWPLIMGLTMWAQQKLNPAPADPIQQKMFMFLPFVFTFLLAGFPAGLVIYWAWNNVLSVAQQWVIMRRMHVKISGGVDKQLEPPPSARKRTEEPNGAPASGATKTGAASSNAGRAAGTAAAGKAATAAKPSARRGRATRPPAESAAAAETGAVGNGSAGPVGGDGASPPSAEADSQRPPAGPSGQPRPTSRRRPGGGQRRKL